MNRDTVTTAPDGQRLAALVAIIRRVETATHPEQRGWWTWLPLLLGAFGLLGWLRHLDREH